MEWDRVYKCDCSRQKQILKIPLTKGYKVFIIMNIKWLIEKINASSKAYPTRIFKDKNKIYTCINPYKYHMVRQNPELYQQMDGIFVDGILMVWLYRIFLRKKIPRLSFDMTAIAKDLFQYLDKNQQLSIFFIGSTQQAVKSSVSKFQEAYPTMNVIGFRNGYFKNEKERKESIEYIIHKNPSFTIVGLGGNIQEQYAIDLKNKGYQGIVFTCGGFLHQSTKKINYYPKWIDKYNLRGVYRILKERNFKRFHYFFSFILQFISDKMKSY